MDDDRFWRGLRSLGIENKTIVQCFPHLYLTWSVIPGILTAAQVYLVTHHSILYLDMLYLCMRTLTSMID